MNRNEGKSCPGEEECGDARSKDRGPLSKYEDADVESICGGCKLRDSKPESIPDELIFHFTSALRLERVYEMGGRFQYPDGLTPLEWEILDALKTGRSQAEKLKPKPKT